MAVALTKNRAVPSVEEEKNELAIRLLSLNDQFMVHTIKLILDDLMSVSKKQKRVTKAAYNKEIDAALKRVRGGNSVSNDDVMNEMENW